jgi:hypothetical protein
MDNHINQLKLQFSTTEQYYKDMETYIEKEISTIFADFKIQFRHKNYSDGELKVGVKIYLASMYAAKIFLESTPSAIWRPEIPTVIGYSTEPSNIENIGFSIFEASLNGIKVDMQEFSKLSESELSDVKIIRIIAGIYMNTIMTRIAFIMERLSAISPEDPLFSIKREMIEEDLMRILTLSQEFIWHELGHCLFFISANKSLKKKKQLQQTIKIQRSEINYTDQESLQEYGGDLGEKRANKWLTIFKDKYSLKELPHWLMDI